jgi:hypothetical protein
MHNFGLACVLNEEKKSKIYTTKTQSFFYGIQIKEYIRVQIGKKKRGICASCLNDQLLINFPAQPLQALLRLLQME